MFALNLGLASADALSILAIVAGTIVLVLLERLIPYNRGQKLLRDGFFDDMVLYTLAQNYVLSIVIFSGIVGPIDRLSGLSRLHLIGHWPMWAQVLFFLVTHDFYIYWMHRWQHRNRYLWRLHEAHHSPGVVDWLAGARSHALEILINQTIEFAPMILLGASPAVIPIKGAISAIWGMYIHANLDLHTGVLQRVINGPEMHRWHHAIGPGMGMNFSTKLAIWDWLFGTAYCPPGKHAQRYGLKTFFPARYLAQTFYAFRRFRQARPSR